jgi:hypothetical protein
LFVSVGNVTQVVPLVRVIVNTRFGLLVHVGGVGITALVFILGGGGGNGGLIGTMADGGGGTGLLAIT